MSGTVRLLILILFSFLFILMVVRFIGTVGAGDSPRLVWISGDPEEIPFEMKKTDRLRVDVWFEVDERSTEALQVLAGQWKLHDEMRAFEAFDAADTDGLDSSGYLGAIFDGRFIYFSPQHNRDGRHGTVLRYDTHRPFHEESSWSAYDAGHVDGMQTRGFYGGVFDGRYVYFTPRFDGEELHTRTLRYDTELDFYEADSWSAYDVGLGISYQGAGFDGRYVYFAPGSSSDGHSGMMLRYDTESPFREAASWQTVDVDQLFPELDARDYDGVAFDGRWVYFVPLVSSVPVRYDTRQSFEDPQAWQAFDASSLGMEMCVGATFDGRYLYFVPYDHHTVVRYEVAKPFEEASSWSAYDVRQTDELEAWGYDGGFFDGRYVTFIPFFYTNESGTMNFHGEVLRYDTFGSFQDPESWISRDQSQTDGLYTVGYNAGIFDGRYFYFAPWHDGEAYHDSGRIIGHSRVLRYDSLEEGSFLLRYSDYGHNGGLSGALPGPSFTINTNEGPRTVSVNRVLEPGEYLITGLFDGESIRIYINGERAAERPVSGQLMPTNHPLSIGQLTGGGALLNGRITRVELNQ